MNESRILELVPTLWPCTFLIICLDTGSSPVAAGSQQVPPNMDQKHVLFPPDAWWFPPAAVEGERGSPSQSRGRSDQSAAGARSLGRGLAGVSDSGDSEWQDRHLPVRQELHGSSSQQRPRGAEVRSSPSTSSPSFLCPGSNLNPSVWTRTWLRDLPKGACALVCVSVDHSAVAAVGVRANVLLSRYYVEPCGGNKSRLTHISRVDCR